VESQPPKPNIFSDLAIVHGNKISLGTYLHGHPDINNQIEYINGYENATQLLLINEAPFGTIKLLAKIEKTSVQDVLIEDASTIEKRLTLTRIALLGPFAWALKKKKVTEQAYLTIKWKLGKFENDTTFLFEGKAAMTKANASRNSLLKLFA
jgi:hypothetical protein